MTPSDPTPPAVSSCCRSRVLITSDEDGTSCYLCGACGKGCDLATPEQPSGMLTASELREIEDRLSRTTDGPWTTAAEHNDIGHIDFIWGTMWKGKERKRVVCGDMDRGDADFLAHSRQDIPALLRHISAQDQWMREARELMAKAGHSAFCNTMQVDQAGRYGESCDCGIESFLARFPQP